MTAWWISWYSNRPRAEFELHSPWWVSGYDADDRDILVAAVLAEDEPAAWRKIRQAYDDPRQADDIIERFCDELEQSPFGGRWPKAEWMDWDLASGRTCACGACSAGVESVLPLAVEELRGLRAMKEADQ